MADTDIQLTVDLDVKDAESTAKDLQKEIESIFKSRSGQSSASLTSLEIQMKKTYDRAKELRTSMEELGSKEVETDAYKTVLAQQEKFTKIYDDLLAKITALQEADLKDNEGGDISDKLFNSEKYQKLMKQFEDVEGTLDILEKKREAMEKSNMAYILGSETEQYKKQQIELDSINDKLKQQVVHYQQIKQVSEEKSIQNSIQQANMETIKANSNLMALNMSIRSIGRIIPGVSTTAISGIVMLTRAIMRLTNMTKVQLVGAINAVKTAFVKLFTTIMAHPIILVITAITAAVVALVKVFKGLREEAEAQLDAVGEKLGELFDRFKELAKEIIPALIKGFIRLGDALPRTLLTLVRGLIEKLKSLKGIVKENLDLMAQWNEGNNAVNTALSNLTSSLKYLKASLATAFAPILTYVEPVLTHLTDLIAEAVNVIGMFIAKLTGATSYTRAIRVQNDYAESLDKTAKSAKEATGALASFDKLNVIDTDKTASGTAKNMGVDFKQLEFKNTPLPNWLDDFEKLGKKLSKKINKFLTKKINWNFIKERAEAIGKDIAGFFNGLSIGSSLGLTIGEGLNTVTTAINSFLEEFKGLHFGEQLGELIETAITTINWTDIGNMFSGGFNTLCEVIRGLTDKVEGEELGKAFTDFLDGSLGKINWANVHYAIEGVMEDIVGFFNETITPQNFELIGKTLGETLNSVMTGINVFVKKAKWEEWGDSVATGIDSFLRKTDFTMAGETVNNLLQGLLDMIGRAVDYLSNPTNLQLITDKIVDFFGSIKFEEIGKKAIDIMKKLREGLQKIWDELKKSDAFDQIIQMIVDFLNEIDNWKRMFSGFKSDVVSATIWAKIKSAFVNVGNSIANFFNTYIIGPIVNAFNSIKDWLGSFSDASGFVNQMKAVGNGAIPYIPKVEGFATGAVLPPNKPFLGVLGDQKNGTNIEAPLDTIKQAVAEVIGTMGINVVLDVQGDPKKIFKATQQEAKVFYKQTGKNAFANT